MSNTNVLPFQPKPKLAPGERPKRRTDAEMVAELDNQVSSGRLAGNSTAQELVPDESCVRANHAAGACVMQAAPLESLIAHAKEGEPKGVA
jgi:hypothetical protein